MLRLNSFVLGNIMRSCTFYFQKTSQEQQSEKDVCIQHCQGDLLFRYAFWESTWQMNVVFVSSHSSQVLLVNRAGWFELSFKLKLLKRHWAQDLNAGGLWPQEAASVVLAGVSLTLVFISFVWLWGCLICGHLAARFFKAPPSWPFILCC